MSKSKYYFRKPKRYHGIEEVIVLDSSSDSEENLAEIPNEYSSPSPPPTNTRPSTQPPKPTPSPKPTKVPRRIEFVLAPEPPPDVEIIESSSEEIELIPVELNLLPNEVFDVETSQTLNVTLNEFRKQICEMIDPHNKEHLEMIVLFTTKTAIQSKAGMDTLVRYMKNETEAHGRSLYLSTLLSSPMTRDIFIKFSAADGVNILNKWILTDHVILLLTIYRVIYEMRDFFRTEQKQSLSRLVVRKFSHSDPTIQRTARALQKHTFKQSSTMQRPQTITLATAPHIARQNDTRYGQLGGKRQPLLPEKPIKKQIDPFPTPKKTSPSSSFQSPKVPIATTPPTPAPPPEPYFILPYNRFTSPIPNMDDPISGVIDDATLRMTYMNIAHIQSDLRRHRIQGSSSSQLITNIPQNLTLSDPPLFRPPIIKILRQNNQARTPSNLQTHSTLQRKRHYLPSHPAWRIHSYDPEMTFMGVELKSSRQMRLTFDGMSAAPGIVTDTSQFGTAVPQSLFPSDLPLFPERRQVQNGSTSSDHLLQESPKDETERDLIWSHMGSDNPEPPSPQDDLDPAVLEALSTTIKSLSAPIPTDAAEVDSSISTSILNSSSSMSLDELLTGISNPPRPTEKRISTKLSASQPKITEIPFITSSLHSTDDTSPQPENPTTIYDAPSPYFYSPPTTPELQPETPSEEENTQDSNFYWIPPEQEPITKPKPSPRNPLVDGTVTTMPVSQHAPPKQQDDLHKLLNPSWFFPSQNQHSSTSMDRNRMDEERREKERKEEEIKQEHRRKEEGRLREAQKKEQERKEREKREHERKERERKEHERYERERNASSRTKTFNHSRPRDNSSRDLHYYEREKSRPSNDRKMHDRRDHDRRDSPNVTPTFSPEPGEIIAPPARPHRRRSYSRSRSRSRSPKRRYHD